MTRKYPLRGYFLGVLSHTTAWDRHWGPQLSWAVAEIKKISKLYGCIPKFLYCLRVNLSLRSKFFNQSFLEKCNFTSEGAWRSQRPLGRPACSYNTKIFKKQNCKEYLCSVEIWYSYLFQGWGTPQFCWNITLRCEITFSYLFSGIPPKSAVNISL